MDDRRTVSMAGASLGVARQRGYARRRWREHIMSRTVVVLAAGEGKRMKSALPKVLHPLLGRTMLGHVLAAAEPLGAQRTVVVVGNGAERVREHLATIAPDAVAVLQERQLGTGHAVRV